MVPEISQVSVMNSEEGYLQSLLTSSQERSINQPGKNQGIPIDTISTCQTEVTKSQEKFLDLLQNTTVLRCGHSFYQTQRFIEHIRIKQLCPSCRASVTEENPINYPAKSRVFKDLGEPTQRQIDNTDASIKTTRAIIEESEALIKKTDASIERSRAMTEKVDASIKRSRASIEKSDATIQKSNQWMQRLNSEIENLVESSKKETKETRKNTGFVSKQNAAKEKKQESVIESLIERLSSFFRWVKSIFS